MLGENLHRSVDGTLLGVPLESPKVEYTISDDMIKTFYDYKIQKGFKFMLINILSDYVVNIFMMLTIMFMCGCVDYSFLDVSDSRSDSTTTPISNYIYCSDSYYNYLFIIAGLLCLFIYTTYTLFSIKNTIVIRNFYINVLKIYDVNNYSWESISNKLSMTERYRHLSTFDLNKLITQHDDTIYFMVKNGKFNIDLPLLGRTNVFTQTTYSFMIKCLYIKKYIDYSNSGSVGTRIFSPTVISLTLVCLLPIMLVVMLFYNLFKYLQQLPSETRPSFNILSKDWNWLAKWEFRKECELPHSIEYRLSKAYPLMVKFNSQFHSAFVTNIVPKVLFIMGTILSIFVAISLYSDMLLWKLTIYNHSLMAVMSLFIFLMAILYSLIPHKYFIPQPDEYIYDLLDALEITHDIEECVDETVEDHDLSGDSVLINGMSQKHKLQYTYFTKYFKPKWVIAITEYMSVLTLPYIIYLA